MNNLVYRKSKMWDRVSLLRRPATSAKSNRQRCGRYRARVEARAGYLVRADWTPRPFREYAMKGSQNEAQFGCEFLTIAWMCCDFKRMLQSYILLLLLLHGQNKVGCRIWKPRHTIFAWMAGKVFADWYDKCDRRRHSSVVGRSFGSFPCKLSAR